MNIVLTPLKDFPTAEYRKHKKENYTEHTKNDQGIPKHIHR